MIEVIESSVRSIPRQVRITEPPTRFSRWCTRHYQHVGLASMAGSAILVFLIVVILLPIALKDHAANQAHTCSNQTESLLPTARPTISIGGSSTLPYYYRLAKLPSRVFDPLCPETAVWIAEGVTVAGSFADLNNPSDFFFDDDDNLFIADSGNNRIICRLYSTNETHVVAGTGAYGSWSNLLKYPTAIVAWNDHLYVSDSENYRILLFPLTTTAGSPDGRTLVGQYGLGSSLNQINGVNSMAIDTDRERFYLSDTRNDRLLTMDLNNSSLELFVGLETAGSNSQRLNLPLGLTINSKAGSLFVADSANHRIQKFDLYSNPIGQTVAGGNGQGQNLNQLNLPSGVTQDSIGNLYIADTKNHRILQWLSNAQQGRIIAGTGVSGNMNTQLNNPVQVKFDRHNNLYIADQKNNRIQRFDLISNGC